MEFPCAVINIFLFISLGCISFLKYSKTLLYVSFKDSVSGMNSLGIAPPLILLSISLPLPGSNGSTVSFTLAN